MTKRVTNHRYDVSGLECQRVIRILLLWKILRLDDISGKPSLRDSLELWIHHHLGGYAAVITVKYERKWLESLRKYRHTRDLVKRRAGLYKAKLLGRL